MAQITDIKAFTDYWKEKFPEVYKDKTDEEIINYISQRYPELKLPSYQESLVSDKDYTSKQTNTNYDEDSLANAKTDPSWVDSWFLTGDFVPDKWQKEGFLGGSPDFWRSSYNNSMAGNFYKTMKGHIQGLLSTYLDHEQF